MNLLRRSVRRSSARLTYLVLALAVGLGVGLPAVSAAAGPAPLAAPADGSLKILLFYKANFHASQVEARQAVRNLTAELATQYSQTVEIQETEDPAAFTTENLATKDAVVFAQTGGVLFNDAQRAALEAYIRGGGGYFGLHYAGWSVGTSEHDVNPFYRRLVGAMSEGHPEDPAVRPGRVVVKDAGHPLTQGLPADFTRSDEWYDWVVNPAPNVRTLLEADEESYGGGRLGTSHPITWCQQIDSGRSWYTGMGHAGTAYSEPHMLTQMRNGLAYAAGLLPADCSPPSKAVNGAMSEVTPWPLMPINAALTSDGTVQSFGSTSTGCTDNAPYDFDGNGCISQGGQFEIDIWNPEVPRTLANLDHGLMPNTTYTDLFCSMQVQDPHRGATMTVGGDDSLGANDPNDAAIGVTTYTTNNGLQNDAPMNLPRWYPTGTTMPNGDIVVQGGALRGGPGGPGVLTPEIRTADEGSGWRLLTGARSPAAYGDGGADHAGQDENRWWYPRAFVAPGSGNLFNISGTQMFELDPSGDGEVTLRGTLPAGISNQGAQLGNPVGATSTATMYRPGKILQVGGGWWANGGGPAGARAGFTVDITGGTAQPVVEATAPMKHRRHWATSTVLPDGDVLVTGGGRENNGGGGVATNPEIWDPETGEWTTVEVPQQHARLYHSTALLLPDGRVMIGGGGAPGPRNYTDVEYYSPAYLFDGEQPAERPEITDAPEEIGYNGTFDIASSTEVSRVTLVRNGSVTHGFNNDQNFQDLEFTQDEGTGEVTITAPADGTYAPPGAYMLFVFDADGTPSVASMMDLDPEVAMDVRTPQVVDQFEYPRVPTDWRGGNPAGVVDVAADNGRMAPWSVDSPVQLVRARNEANGGLGATGYHLALGGSGSLERTLEGLEPGRDYRLSLRYARDGRSAGAAPATGRLAVGSLDTTLTATTDRSSRTRFDTYVGTFAASKRSETLTLSQTGAGAGLVVDDLVVIGVDAGLSDVPIRYEFEEGEGTSVANTGTDDSVGAATLTGATGWSPNGVVGGALELPGGTNANTVDLPDNLLQDEDSFTTSFWVRPDTKGNWINLFHIGDGLEGAGSFFQVQMQTQADGNTGLAATFKEKGSNLQERIYANPTRDVDAGAWNHVVVTREGATATLYLNGEAIASRDDLTIDMTDVGPTSNNWLGRNGYPDPAFDGLMDEVRLYRSALTDTDVAALYADGASLRTTTTVTVDPASPSPFGEPLSVSAQVEDEADAAAGGEAELWVDGARVGVPVALVSGAVTFPELTLSPGEHEIEVRYLAADGWRPSRASVTHTVERPPPGEGVPIHYAFDENAGTTSANTGSDPSVGAATLLGETSWAPGKHGAAASLPGGGGGSSNYVDLPDNIDAGLDEEFTVSLWARPDALPNWVPLLQIGSSTDTFFLLQSSTQANGPTGFAATFKAPGNPTQERLTLGGGTDLPIGDWTHVVFTMSGSTGRIYFDGELMNTRNDFTLGIGDIGVGGETTVNALGSTSWPDPKFDGLIDDFRMYGYELSGDQVSELYDAPVGSADSYSTAHGQALTVPAPGVLANDTDAQDDVLTATDATQPEHGQVTLQPDGSFTYTPEPGFSGTDGFTYKVSGGGLSSAPTAVTITVAEPNGTTVSGSAGRVTYGRAGTVAVAVSPATATGRVDVLSGSRVLGSGTVTAGKASVALPARALAPGTHPLTLRYAGDASHDASTGQVQLVVVKAVPVMKVQAPGKVKRGKRATVKVTLTAPGVTLTGQVRVTVKGKKVVGTVRNGRVVLRLPKAARVGRLKATVAYLGSPYAAAVTRSVTIRVTR
ncbi:LamG-like jellyroll fold domain-containing protein [Nocardioides lijunqiniae]|uniref:LamG-like jellyroll fold domain-containing protein n=1 Tax=Nocardioides lijunqiniae TaxID=2760832 RepID=UPI0018776A1F|nr:LamG-like jellyroll fold domain-containing protein [Nocardioides lijunqiniae]